jgi:hypothetical protein
MTKTQNKTDDLSIREVYERLLELEIKVNTNVTVKKNQLKQIIVVIALLFFLGLVNAALVIIHIFEVL